MSNINDILKPKSREDFLSSLDTKAKRVNALYSLVRDSYVGSIEFLYELESLFADVDKIWRRTWNTYSGYDRGEQKEFRENPREFILETDGDDEALWQFLEALTHEELGLGLLHLAGIDV